MHFPHALVIFTDIRGFTRFAQHVEVAPHLGVFVKHYYFCLATAFPTALIKPLGDGAMLVETISLPTSEDDILALAGRVLQQITQATRGFAEACTTFAINYGHRAPLQLGWGVTRGVVTRLDAPEDYIGANVNEAERLCELARPAGIVLDREDFAVLPLPADTGWTFVPVERHIRGMEDMVSLWMTDTILPVSPPAP